MAVKLDVDTEVLEVALMKQMAQPELAPAIAEIFWEQHFRVGEMDKYWHGEKLGLEADWVAALERFNRYRSAGLRLHYWP